MKIKSIYIGGWFQRTTLQLSEIYDFLRDGTSQLGLEEEKLFNLREALHIESIEYGVANEEFVAFVTEEQVRVRLYEDGLMIVSSQQVSEPTLFADVERLRGYYEDRLSPALNYLFSTGAPVFKELTHVENIFPYFIVCNNATNEAISELLAKTERQKYFEFEGKNYSVLRGDKYYFINNKKSNLDNIERYIEEQIFSREFKGQLHRYLNLHRAIWGKIDNIKRQKSFTSEELISATSTLERYEKTALLISGRLKQMSTYIQIRERGVQNDPELTEFLAISGYRYPALQGTLTYVRSLWKTTRLYLESTQRLLARVEQEKITNSLRTIIILLLILLSVSILGLVFGTVLKFSIDNIIYLATLIVITIVGVQIFSSLARKKRYLIFNPNEEKK